MSGGLWVFGVGRPHAPPNRPPSFRAHLISATFGQTTPCPSGSPDLAHPSSLSASATPGRGSEPFFFLPAIPDCGWVLHHLNQFTHVVKVVVMTKPWR